MRIVGEEFRSEACNDCSERDICSAGMLLEEVVVRPLAEQNEKIRSDGGPIDYLLFSSSVGEIGDPELKAEIADITDKYTAARVSRTTVFETMVQEGVEAMYDLDGNNIGRSPALLAEMERIVLDNQSVDFQNLVIPEKLFIAAEDVNRFAQRGLCGAIEVAQVDPGPLVNLH